MYKEVVLVTGGAGYIGSHAVVELLDLGYKVIVLDSLENGYLDLVDNRAKFIKGDIRKIETIENIFKENKIDVVMHFAGYIKVGESVEKPNMYYLNNTYGVMNIIEMMKKYEVKNIIFSSTAAVYGEVDTDKLIDEKYPTNPINPYGKSKLMAEKIIIDSCKSDGLNYAIFRYFNVGGAHPKYRIGQKGDGITALIPMLLKTAKGERENINIYGNDYKTKDGTGIRDYIHVVDLVKAHISAIEVLKKGVSDIYNLGNGEGFSVLEMIEACKKVTGVDIAMRIIQRRAGDPAKVVASNKKAKDILGWIPEYTKINQIIDSAWNWYKNI